MKIRQDVIRKDLDSHWADSTRHIDPTRDGAAAKALTRRLDNIEEMVRELVTNQRARRRKEDSEDE